MEGSVGYLFAIVFVVVAINLYMVTARMRRGNRRKKMNRIAVDEAKQALWRDREIERRLEREQDGALERVKLREETLALYDEVRRRHADKNRLEGLGFSADGNGEFKAFGNDESLNEAGQNSIGFESNSLDSLGLESQGLDSARLENPELDSYLSGDAFDNIDADEKVELIELESFYTSDDNDIDPFDIFKKKKK